MTTYKTLEIVSQSEFKDRGSIFIGSALRVDDEISAKKEIEGLKKLHLKASHVCFAYKTNFPDTISRVNDDGEPVYTAGVPIMNMISKYSIENAIVMVVRYFGGTLLGKGGLINAYSQTAESAILNNRIIETKRLFLFTVKVGFDQYHTLLDLLKKFSVEIIKQRFDSECHLEVLAETEIISHLTNNFHFDFLKTNNK